MFSVVDLLLFRSLPYPEAHRLVSLGFSGPIDNNEFNTGGPYLAWRDRQTSFVSMTSMYPAGECDLGGGAAVRINCYSVEANFLETLGIRPIAGRDFRPEDDRPHAPRVALISYGLWQSRFGGDPRAVGKTLELDGAPVRVAGVLPRRFEMPQLGEADVLLTEQMDQQAARSPSSTIFLRTFARLKPGETVETARERLRPLFEESVRLYVPASLQREAGLVVRSLRDRQIHDSKLGAWLLFGAVLTLVALACANVANLLLARAASRRRELAMRAALGAGRGRLVRQALVESLVLSVASAVAGCGFAWVLLRTFIALSPEGLLRLEQARLDGRVLVFALGAAVLAAVATGVVPAWQRPGAAALAGWRTAGPARSGLRQVLVAAQVALSLVLLAGASLLVRSLWKMQTEPLGFQPERVITASITLSRQRYGSAAQQDAFYGELERRLARIPGIGQVALSDSIPPSGGMHGRPFSNMRVAGAPPLPENGGMVAFRYVTPGYFRALGIPVRAGRDFEAQDRAADDTAVIVDESLARRLFGAQNPIGQHLDLDASGHWLPVVGMVGDVRNLGLRDKSQPEYYRARTYRATQLGRSAVVVLRTALDEATVARWVRAEIAGLDPGLPVTVAAMQERVSRLAERPRFLAALIGLFAGLGLLVAAIGLYGVLSFLIAQRTREIGVRMALGATPRDIAVMVGRQAALWTGLGAAIGIVASAALSRAVRGVLFQVSPYDPVSLGSAVALLALVAGSRRGGRRDGRRTWTLLFRYAATKATLSKISEPAGSTPHCVKTYKESDYLQIIEKGLCVNVEVPPPRYQAVLDCPPGISRTALPGSRGKRGHAGHIKRSFDL